MSFSDYRSATPTGALIPAGIHTVAVEKAMLVNSWMKYDRETGGFNDEGHLSKWIKPTEQIMLKLVNEAGQELTVRVNGEAYMNIDKYTPEQIQEMRLTSVQGFACTQDPSGKYIRIPSEEKTEICYNIINKLFLAGGIPKGSSVQDFLDAVLAGSVKIGVKIVEEEYNGKIYRDVGTFFTPPKGGERASADIPKTPTALF